MFKMSKWKNSKLLLWFLFTFSNFANGHKAVQFQSDAFFTKESYIRKTFDFELSGNFTFCARIWVDYLKYEAALFTIWHENFSNVFNFGKFFMHPFFP